MWSFRSFVSLALVSCLPVVTASAATLNWPGTLHSPCGQLSLQECINISSYGGIVQVTTNSPIEEDLGINKSLTLRAAAGFAPVLGALHTISLTNPIFTANTIVVQDLTLQNGRIFAVQNGSTFNVSLRNLTIQNTFNGSPEIQIRTGQQGPYGPVIFDISNNRLTIPAGSQFNGAEAISIDGGSATSMTGVIRNNRIDHFDGRQQGAIALYNNTSNPLDIDVIANEIRGSNYNSGINLFQFGGGTSSVRYLDNLVVGQTSEAGAPGAYVVNITSGSATFEIVNNTAADGDYGIRVTGRDDVGASWSGWVANNIVSGMTEAGIGIGQPTQSSGTVENDHNLTFDVGANYFTPGPGTRSANPLFVGGTDYHLTDPSPGRNSGNPARVPADLTTDLGGSPRHQGVVDMGAYESDIVCDYIVPVACDAIVPSASWGACGTTVGTVASVPGFVLFGETHMMARDAADGVFMGWPSPSQYGVFLNHTTADGSLALGWPAGGVVVASDSFPTPPALVSDGSGGVFVVWTGRRNGATQPSIYCQRLTESGATASGWPASGVVVPIPGFVNEAHATSDGSGGLYISDAQSNKLFRLNGAGAVAAGWPPNGLSLANLIDEMISDEAGGVFLVLGFDGTALTRVAGNAAILWQTSLTSGVWENRLVADLSGGVYFAGGDYGVVVHHIQADGTRAAGWPTGGIVLNSTAGLAKVSADGAGGALLCWTEAGTPTKVVLQRLTPSGCIATGWPANGFRVGPASQRQALPGATTDGTGGAFLTWHGRTGTGPVSLCATRVCASGTVAPGWPADGAEVCPNLNYSASGGGTTAMISDGAGGAFANFYRRTATSGFAGTLQVQRLGSVPPSMATAPVPVGSPSTASVGNATVTFATVTTAGELFLDLTSGPPPPAGLQTVPADVVHELNTSAVFTGGVQVCLDYDPAAVSGSENALRLLHYEGASGPPAWVDITTNVDVVANRICGTTTSLSPFAIVEQTATDAELPPKAGFTLRQNIPNPFNPTTTIEFGMSERGKVRLCVFDVSGRLVRSLVEDIRDPGVHRVLWQGNDNNDKRCSSGLYFYRIETPQGTLTRRMVLVR